jgi:hypothetical protein
VWVPRRQKMCVCVCVCVCVCRRCQQRQVTKQIMTAWTLHRQMARNPPTDRMRDVHMLHQSQSLPMLDEGSSLRRDVCVCVRVQVWLPRRQKSCVVMYVIIIIIIMEFHITMSARRGSQDGRKAGSGEHRHGSEAHGQLHGRHAV